MAKERLIACIHYVNEHNCDLGKECEFWGHCQTCKTYSAIRGGAPARVDKRRQKKEKISKKELKSYIKDVKNV